VVFEICCDMCQIHRAGFFLDSADWETEKNEALSPRGEGNWRYVLQSVETRAGPRRDVVPLLLMIVPIVTSPKPENGAVARDQPQTLPAT